MKEGQVSWVWARSLCSGEPSYRKLQRGNRSVRDGGVSHGWCQTASCLLTPMRSSPSLGLRGSGICGPESEPEDLGSAFGPAMFFFN